MLSKTRRDIKRTRRIAGGAATGAGINFQAIVTAIAGVHLIKGNPLGWLDGLVDDTPVAVWAETGGPGDDIKLELRDKSITEVQIKRGLQTGDRLWDSLMSLARAVTSEEISYGLLIVSPDASRTIAYDLSRDIRRLADGRTDNLGSLAVTFCSKLEMAGLQPHSICKRLRMHIVHGLDGDGASISATKAFLGSLVFEQEDVNAAWNRLYREAHSIMERKGRWEASVILRMFVAEGIKIKGSEAPGSVLDRLTRWVIDTNQSFSILGVRKPLSVNEAWLPLQIMAIDSNREPESGAAEAMAHYHAIGKNYKTNTGAKISDAEWIGRFYPRAVLTGGPGLGKSTLLTKAAQLYAKDGFPVLKVKLNTLAARMLSGHTFIDSIFNLGLDGSGISPVEAMKAKFRNWVLLCDGLDECQNHQETVADGLQQFASGHPHARIIVTTRPIGYSTAKIADWRHYELLPPESELGSTHLANLLQAVLPTTHKLHENAPDVSTTELKKSTSSEVISRSPLLLGMAASLLMQTGLLGASKTQLYQKLFGLIGNMSNSRSAMQTISQPVLTRMLDILGWELTVRPLDSESAILEHCAEHLEVELGEPHLRAIQIATDCLHHWEDIGLVEKVHHGSETLLTFIHKTFTEFAAARYLRDIKSTETQRTEIVKRLDDTDWVEVLNLASGIGLAETIVSELTRGSGKGTAKQLERALSILVNPDASVSFDMKVRVIKLAFDHVDSNKTDDVFSLGCALAEVTKIHPDLIGPAAASRLQSSRFSTRLIAWTCAVEAGAEYCELDAVPSVIHALTSEVSPRVTGSLLGGLILRASKDEVLLRRLGIAFTRRILQIWPPEIVDQYVKETFNRPQFDTIGFHSELKALYESIGRSIKLPNDEIASVKFMQMFQPGSDYSRAECAALRAVFSNLVPLEEEASGVNPELSLPLQLAALLEIIGFNGVSFRDVWAWTKPYDSEVVREVLRAIVKISAVEESVLAVEAKTMLRRMEKLPGTDSYRVLSPRLSVDAPPPEWSAGRALQIDRTKLEQALGHESVWLIEAATNLLSGLGGMTAEKAKELLAKGHGYGFAAAAHLTLELGPVVATELLLDRLEGPDTPGKYYLIMQLDELDPPWNKRLASVIRLGLMSSDAKLAGEAATLAAKYLESGEPILVGRLLNEAFQHWLIHEKPYPQEGGPIPDSPRETLLKGMLELGIVDDEWLMKLCRDTRRDVQEAAIDAFLDRIAVSEDIRASFVNEIVAKVLPASLLSKALVTKVPFSDVEVRQLRVLLEDEDPKWRLAATKLLNPSYLKSDTIQKTIAKLLADSHPQVRQAATLALDHTEALSS